jgi:adenine-specific DNA-methyltransferase
VLGTIESGVDFEMRIAAIYQACRKPEQIKDAFDELQLELNFEINEAMRSTRQKLLENFDEEVQAKLKLRDESSRAFLSHFEKQLIALTRHELRDRATFHSDSSFSLHTSSLKDVPLGLYVLPRSTSTAHVYRLGHPLAEHLLTQAKERDLPPAELEFHYAEHGSKISILEPLLGQYGTLTVSLFTVESMDQAEDHLIYAACTDAGALLDQEQTRRLLSLPAVVKGHVLGLPAPPVLPEVVLTRQQQIQQIIAKRNTHFYEDEAQKLDGWADDRKSGLEREIKELDQQIKEARRIAVRGLTLEEKLEGQRQVRALEHRRTQRRRALFDAQDQVDTQRDDLISQVEAKLTQSQTVNHILMIRWSLT